MRRKLTLIAFLIAVALASVTKGGASPVEAASDAVSDSLPLYVLVALDDVPPVELPDSIFHTIAGTTIFKVNSTTLNAADPFLTELLGTVRHLTDSCGMRLSAVEFRGSASPEGPYQHNIDLSRGRTEAMARFLADNLGTDTLSTVISRSIAEDYSTLLYMMRAAGDPDASTVARLIEQCGLDNPATLKRCMMKHANGRLWARLHRTYFPRLRAARIVLHMRAAPAPGATRQERHTEGRTISAVTPKAPERRFEVPEITPRAVIERRHALSLGTNMLYDVFWMPNFGWAPMPNITAEFYPRSGKWSLAASFLAPWYQRWSKHKFFQIRDYRLEARRYFHPGLLNTGWYAGVQANATKYAIGLGAKRGWQGEGAGVSLKGGYVLPIASGRWRIDFHIALGAFMTRYDPYVYGNPVTGDTSTDDYYYDWTGRPADFHRRNHRLWWFGPTEVGITLKYDLLYYRAKHKGASTRRKEVLTW